MMERRDQTRLKNLLKNYRDHFITVYFSKYKHLKITEVIELIDDSIDTINRGIK